MLVGISSCQNSENSFKRQKYTKLQKIKPPKEESPSVVEKENPGFSTENSSESESLEYSQSPKETDDFFVEKNTKNEVGQNLHIEKQNNPCTDNNLYEDETDDINNTVQGEQHSYKRENSSWTVNALLWIMVGLLIIGVSFAIIYGLAWWGWWFVHWIFFVLLTALPLGIFIALAIVLITREKKWQENVLLFWVSIGSLLIGVGLLIVWIFVFNYVSWFIAVFTPFLVIFAALWVLLIARLFGKKKREVISKEEKRVKLAILLTLLSPFVWGLLILFGWGYS